MYEFHNLELPIKSYLEAATSKEISFEFRIMQYPVPQNVHKVKFYNNYIKFA